jgi:hypothetical protein
MTSETTNPFRSPMTAPARRSRVSVPAWSRWLVFTSLVLAVLIEVLPTEADVMWVALRRGDVLLFVAAKAFFLTLILGPLLIYVGMNGRLGVRAAWRRIAVISIIVGVKFAMDAAVLVNYPVRN